MPHSKETNEIIHVVESLNPEQRRYVRDMVFRVSALARDLGNPKKKKLAQAVLSTIAWVSLAGTAISNSANVHRLAHVFARA